MNNKKLTLIFAMGVSISNLLIWIYMFSAFIIGYNVTFLEPNIIVASMELIMAIVCLPIIFWTFRERIMQYE